MQRDSKPNSRPEPTLGGHEATNRDPAWTQRVGALTEIPALLRELGVSAAEVLASAGLAADALGDVENRVPFLAVVELLHQCAQATGCAHFGVLAGERWSLSHYGAVGELMLNAPTVGDALRIMVVYQRLHSEVGAVFLLEHEGTASLGYTIYRENVPHQDLLYDLTMAIGCRFLRELCGPRWVAAEVTFSRHVPPDQTPYRLHFRAPLRFDAEYSAVRFPSRWFQQPISGADPERYRTLSDLLAANDSSQLVSRLRRALRLLLISGRSSGDEVAQALSLHRRTLNRRLQLQGTTFQKVLDEVRFEVARHLLEQTRAPIADIAAALCYADVAAFTHAFRRWTGTTPAKWRQSAASS